MKRTLNRILALGMAICMLLSLVVVQASAATTTDGLQSQISAAAGSSVQIVLDGDVTLDQTIQIPAKTAVTITTDGAARTVKRGEGLTAAMFNVPAGSTLTLSGGESRLVLDGASVKASAAMVTSAGTLELTNVDAKNAVNSKTGGAVYLTAGKLSVSGCSFTGNSAKTGGAIDTKTKVKIGVTIADSTFSANTATTNGGAINLMDTNTMTVTNTAFTGNKTTKSAANKGSAAAYVANTSASFDGCTFTENTVAGNTDSVGGALCFYAVSASQTAITVSGSTFTGNTAPNGGAIGLSDSGSFRSGRAIVNWTDCSFTGNSAAGKGGAIAIPYSCENAMHCVVTLSGCTYSGNTAAQEPNFYSADKLNITVDGKVLDPSTTTGNPNYVAYTDVSVVPNVTDSAGTALPDLAGMAVVGDYAYSVKLKTAAKPSGDTTNYHRGEHATLWRTDLKTGETVQLSEAVTNADYVTYVGHANGVAGALEGGEHYLYVATLLVGDASQDIYAVVKLHMSGTTFEKVGEYVVMENGISASKSGIDVLSVDAGKTTLLLKTGGTFYTAEVPHDQTSGELTAVTRFSINTTGVSLTTGAVLDVTGWTWQDCGYHDGRLYVPVCKGASTVVAVYSILNEDGTVKSGALSPDKDCSIQIGDVNHRVVEVESCAVYDGKLYFNANRTLPDGGKDCDCVAWTALPPAPVIEKPDENPAQDALVAKINAAAGSSVVITLTEDMTITSPISIPASTVVELKTDGKAVTLTRGEKLTESLFNVLEGSTLKLTGSDDARITVDGASVEATAAMIASAGTLELTKVDLKNAVSAGAGGAVYMTKGTLTSTDCRYENNRASTGGAVNAQKNAKVHMDFIGGSFTDNTAKTTGGAVNLMDGNTLSAKNVIFRGNKTTASTANKGGGALYVANTVANFEGCTFDSNSVTGKATSTGGAICFYALGASGAKCTVKDCAFTGNSAPIGGAMALSDNGAVRKNGASVDCENVTFTNNTADKGGAIGIPYDCVTSLSCSLNLTDCTFAGNQAAEGSDIYSVSEAGITIKQTEKPDPVDPEPDPKPNPDPNPVDPEPDPDPADPKPTEPADPVAPETPAKPDQFKTGDESHLALWGALALTAAAGAAVCTLRRKEEA